MMKLLPSLSASMPTCTERRVRKSRPHDAGEKTPSNSRPFVDSWKDSRPMKRVCSLMESRSEGRFALTKQPSLTVKSRISSARRYQAGKERPMRESFVVVGKEALPTWKVSSSVAADE